MQLPIIDIPEQDVCDKPKQMIVIRRKYPHPSGTGVIKARTGKMIAQACHATMMFLARQIREATSCPLSEIEGFTSHRVLLTTEEYEWIVTGRFTKVVAQVEDEDGLDEVCRKAKKAGLNVYEVVDSGLTEFGGRPTKTCIAIGPHRSSRIDPVTGDLDLL